MKHLYTNENCFSRQTGNEASMKVRRDSRSAGAPADANKENGKQTHDVGSLIIYKERDGCYASRAADCCECAGAEKDKFIRDYRP